MLKDYIDDINALIIPFFQKIPIYSELLEQNSNNYSNLSEQIISGLSAINELLTSKYFIKSTSLNALIEDEIVLLKNKELNSFKHKSYSIKDAISESIAITDYELSIVLIEKNEDRYIKEWLEFHLMLGVDHFYIYDNGSTDNTRSIIAPYIDLGIVTLIEFLGPKAQHGAYLHALNHFRYDTTYMAFIDTDEYLFPTEGFNLKETINDIFKHQASHKFQSFKAGAIGVNWRNYGPSYHKTPPNGLQIENFTYRGNDDYEENVHIKVIVKPNLVRDFAGNPHNVVYYDADYGTMSENGSLILGPFFFDSKCEKLRINHYYTRSEEDYKNKIYNRGWPDISPEQWKNRQDEALKRLQDCYEIDDHIMDRFIEPLKNRMNNYRK